MYIPPIVFVATTKLVGDLLRRSRRPGPHQGRAPFRYDEWAVRQRDAELFIRQHRGSMPAEALIDLLRANGRHDSAADVAANAARMEARNPGCVVICGNFRA